jgi:ABC-type transport system substrate-binding protein
VFRLCKGVLFHNSREVDAEAVKLNIERIKDPAIGSDWHRDTIENIARAEVIDKYTVRFHMTEPDAAVPVHVLHYPTNLIAPESFASASEHPIGTGPFKFVSWTRWNESRMVRFENYWETDAQGNNLPYLDEIIGKPKREDSVCLTALRTDQINLIDALAFADVKRFQETQSDAYNI